jgi:hypothetical protein
MQVQFGNKLVSSFMMFLDHTLLDKGQAYSNGSGLLYRTTGNINGLNVYATPFRQLVNDISITGANIMSGLWVSGVFSPPGISGIHSINITEGQAYFSGAPASVSGRYAVKDFSVYLTDKPEEEILFETKFDLRSKVPQSLTGLPQDTQTYPVIYIKNMDEENRPFCLGGTDNHEAMIRAIVLGDSQFVVDAACSILLDMARKRFKILEPSGLPFNAYGAMTGVNYNYNSVISSATQESLVWRARKSSLTSARELNAINPSVFASFVDFYVWTIRG